MAKKIATLGEIMMRLSAKDHQKFIQAESFDINYGGSEANVAISLCNYNLPGIFITKLPTTDLGQAAINHLKRFGVDTQFIVRGGEKLGLYFLEPGLSIRSSHIIYDRAHSAMAEASVSEFDFDAIFNGVDWFHTSSITPALSDRAAIITETALKTAKAKGITTSIDLNYRRKLWSPEKAKQVTQQLYPLVDVCIGIDENADLINLSSSSTPDSYKDALQQMKKKFGFKHIACTIREDRNATENICSAIAWDGKEFYQTKRYEVTVADRIGSGDAFAGGLIYGLINDMHLKDAAEFAIAAAALKHTIPGDANHATTDDVTALMNATSFGKVNR